MGKNIFLEKTYVRPPKQEKHPQAQDIDGSLSPEERLWRRVLLLSLQDLQLLALRKKYALNGQGRRIYRDLDALWNCLRSAHFALICEFSGIAHSQVLRVAGQISRGEIIIPFSNRKSKSSAWQMVFKEPPKYD